MPRTLIVTEFISLDGVVDSPGGGDFAHGGWTFTDVPFEETAYEMKGAEQADAGSLLLGAQSFREFAPVWPTMAEFERYNHIPKHVVSTTLTEQEVTGSGWENCHLLRSLDDVAALKNSSEDDEAGSIQVHASPTLAASLAHAGLVDRYHLLVFPLVLGTGGKRLFPTDAGKQKLALVEQESYANGIIKTIYDVAR